jgi:hypothetical protein
VSVVLARGRKIAFFVFFGMFAVFIAFIIIRESTTSTVVLSLNSQDHNPAKTQVLLSGVPVYPRGEGGRIYSTRANTGQATYEISGPFTVGERGLAQVGRFADAEIELSPKSKTVEDILNSLLSPEDLARITRTKHYTNIHGDWIVANWPSTGQTERKTFLLSYNHDINDWELLGAGSKIDYASERTLLAPSEMSSFLEEIAGD